MAELVPMALVLFGLLAVYAILIPGRRADRGNWHDTISGLGRPDGALLVWFLGGLALITLVEVASDSAPPAIVIGAACGLAGTWVASRAVGSVLDLIGVLAGLLTLALFVSGTAPGSTATHPSLTGPLRVVLGTALLASFVAGTAVGILVIPNRSARTFSFGKGRGLAFFGLAEIVTWVVSPFGVDLSLLTTAERLQYAAAALLFTFVLGAVAGQFTLVVAVLGVATVSVLVPAVGLAPDTPALPFAVAFAAVAVLSGALRGRVHRR